MLKSLTLNTAYQLIGKFISLFIGLAITYILTRSISKTEFGQYTLLNALILQTASFIDWGTGFIAVRTAAQQKFPFPALFINLLYLRLISSVAGIVIFLILAYYQSFNIPASLYHFGSIILIPLAFKNALLSIFQAKLKFNYLAVTETTSNLTYLLFLMGFSQQPTLYQALNFHIISTALALIVAILLVARLIHFHTAPANVQLNPTIIKYLLRESLPMGGQLFIFNIYNRLDIFFIQKFHGQTTVASYGLAYKLYENLILLAAYFMNSLYPVLSRSQTQTTPSPQSPSTSTLYTTAFHLLFTSSFIVAFLAIIAAPWIIHLINPDYTDSILPFQILSLALLPAYLNHLNGYTFASLGHQTSFFKIALLALLVNALINFLLIPLYGSTAAALTTVLTESLIALVSIYQLSHTNHLPPQLSQLPHTLHTLFTNPRQLFIPK